MHTTSISLLQRLRTTSEQAAWERFVQLYTPLLCQWARRLGLAGQDEADLVQDVFALLLEKLPTFQYEAQGRFRGWLWTVTLNKWRERWRRHPLPMVQADSQVSYDLAGPDPAQAYSEAEYQQYLVQRAIELMKGEFQSSTWQAFWAFVVQEQPAAEVGRKLGISENAVYLAKGRVLRRLRQELAGLLE
jgi:RNA polymerase sigma-70 factor (ECF subfamily)